MEASSCIERVNKVMQPVSNCFKENSHPFLESHKQHFSHLDEKIICSEASLKHRNTSSGNLQFARNYAYTVLENECVLR